VDEFLAAAKPPTGLETIRAQLARDLAARAAEEAQTGGGSWKELEMMEMNRVVKCETCGAWGYWLSNREDDLPPGHEDDTILCGGDASGLRPDRPYCDDCQMATQMATQQQAERPRTLRRYRFHGQRSVGMWGWNYVPTDVKKACVLEAMKIYKSDDVPFGATPFGETGVLRTGDKMHPETRMLLAPYIRTGALVA